MAVEDLHASITRVRIALLQSQLVFLSLGPLFPPAHTDPQSPRDCLCPRTRPTSQNLCHGRVLGFQGRHPRFLQAKGCPCDLDFFKNLVFLYSFGFSSSWVARQVTLPRGRGVLVRVGNGSWARRHSRHACRITTGSRRCGRPSGSFQ